MIGRLDFFFFVPALLFFILTPVFLPLSSVSLSYFILAVPMRKCLGKHSCMSSPFPIAIRNGTFFFRSVKAMNIWKRSDIKQILLLPLLLLIIMFIIVDYYVYYCCLLSGDRPAGLLFLSYLLYVFPYPCTPLYLPSTSVTLSYLIMFNYCCSQALVFRKTLVHKFYISNSHAEWYFFQIVQLQVHNVYSERKSRNTQAIVNLYL